MASNRRSSSRYRHRFRGLIYDSELLVFFLRKYWRYRSLIFVYTITRSSRISKIPCPHLQAVCVLSPARITNRVEALACFDLCLSVFVHTYSQMSGIHFCPSV
ncbi:hypothetical protein DFJ58DRAFT_841271 [Suillus subalutaceus]|uniref:uncharacterized protein n=1 Tax=Suillus subalutaceus TaxID=48586 RepID=UPI001B880A0D|nr:uncharacterized protein DFJ58DRAFT_841271 [Suillus subalutaceus]KAG1854782.1 hypothetical protein DFJ58DRAFT_841271 [Suillus subalutaceus]